MSAFSDSNGCFSVAPSGTGRRSAGHLASKSGKPAVLCVDEYCLSFEVIIFASHSLVPEILVLVAFRSVGAATLAFCSRRELVCFIPSVGVDAGADKDACPLQPGKLRVFGAFYCHPTSSIYFRFQIARIIQFRIE